MMIAKDWSTITLITVICAATLTNLFSPVICFRIHDLDDFPVAEKPKIKLSHGREKLLDDIEDQLDADLIPPNFQPDPLLPGNVDENFEDIGQLNKKRIGKGEDDPFNRYIGNVFDSLPKAKDIFDALRLNNQLDFDGGDLSAFPPELLIPLLMDPRVSGSEDEEDQESRNGEKQDKSLKMIKLILDDKHSINKSSSKDHGDRKLVGKLITSLPKSSTSLTDKDTTIKPITGKPSDPQEEESIDEKEDEIHEDEDKSTKKPTTKSGKSKHNPFKWLSKSKSTTPKIGKKGHSKTTIDSGKITSTTEKPESYDEDEDDDDDLSLNSSNSTTTTTSTESSKSSSSTIQPSTHGKSSTSTTTKGSKANKSSTSSSTTSQSTESDSQLTTNNSTSSPLTTTPKTKSSIQISTTSTEKSTKTSKKDGDEDEDEDDNDDDDKIDATSEDQVDAFLSALNDRPEQSKEDKKAISTTPSTTTINSIESELEHSDKHDKTTVTNSTSADNTDKSTTIKSDEANKKSSSTTNEPEPKTTIKPKTYADNPDTFPIISVTRSKAKSEGSTTTHRPPLTTTHHKTSRHPSTTPIPTLRPYVSDYDDHYLPIWNPDVFP